MTKELSKAYEAKDHEDKIYEQWEESGLFNPDVCVAKGVCAKDAPHFSMVLPPPNVTGTLHIGHASMLAIEDLLTRYHRMKGDRTLWLPGTDHAAIATQTKVEKLLMEKGMKDPRHELGRDKFLKAVDKFAQESHDTIVNQCKKMGSSMDWSREAFTLDEERNLAVRTVFKKMYDDGLIYRGYRIVNWCPRCHSTLADDEVEYKEQTATLYTFIYSADFPMAIATTRPETKLGDTAVAVNPKDKRYKKYIGQVFAVKNFAGGADLNIQIIADESIAMDFGTGALGVTPAHSHVDYEMAQKNKLEIIKVIDEDGKMTAAAGADYNGLSVAEARKKVVEKLQADGLLEKEEEIANNLSVCYRCGTAIEPLPSKQWFISVSSKFKVQSSKLIEIKNGQEVTLKELMQSVVKSGEIKIIPDRFEKTYFHWIDNLRDWCVSRQIWYGHRIPVWYCACCGEPKVDIEPKGNWYFVRHGETAWNVEKRAQGQTDNPLNDNGREQAKKAAEQLQSLPIDLVLSSDLVRAHETAEIIAKECGGVEVFTDASLRERNLAELEGAPYTELWDKQNNHKSPYDFAAPGTESLRILEERIWNAIQTHKETHHHKNVVVVSHGTALRTFLRRVRNTSHEEMIKGKGLQNAQVVHFSIIDPCEKCGCDFAEQDPDTLDTWFSSGLWTFSTLGYPDLNTPDLKNYHPTSVLETGYDILFFWVARMILMTTYTLGEIPFETVYLHGLVRDEQGRKMSKSLGNVIDPLDMIAKYGADATRLSLLIGNAPGNDTKLSEEKIAGFRNFTNKLWNIARFIQGERIKEKGTNEPSYSLSLSDKWILARLNSVISEVTTNIEKFNFSYAGEVLRDFTWGELADWYLEICKIQNLKSKTTPNSKLQNDELLNYILETVLKLWHPFMPFVTEAIWQNRLQDTGYKLQNHLMIERWPESKVVADNKIEKDFELIRNIITGIRSLRAEYKIEPVKKLSAVINGGDKVKLLEENKEVIIGLARLSDCQIAKLSTKPDGAVGFVVGGMEIFVDLSGTVDVEKEKISLNTEIAQLEKYIAGLEQKLNNADFVSRAPAEIIEKERQKLGEAREKVEKMNSQLGGIRK